MINWIFFVFISDINMVLQVMDENRKIRDHVPQMVGDSLISDRFDNRKRLQICVGQFLVNAKGNFQDFEESFMLLSKKFRSKKRSLESIT